MTLLSERNEEVIIGKGMKDKFRMWIHGWVYLLTGLALILTLGFYRPRWVLAHAMWIAYQRHKDETE